MRPHASIMANRILLVAAAAGAALLAAWLVPGGADPLARRGAGIFAAAAVLWSTKAIPLFATSLLVVFASVLLLAEDGGLAPTGGIEAGRFLAPLGSDIIALFFGGLLLSVAMSKHGVAEALAVRILAPAAGRPLLLVFAVLGASAGLSMWMSNTATTAMMLAITAPLVAALPSGSRFATGIVAAVAMGANIGGIGTPIGSPPNAIALSALRDAGYEVGFLDWMRMAMPLAAVLLGFAGGWIWLLYRPEEGAEPSRMDAKRLGPRGWATVAVLALAAGGWLSSGWHGVPDGVVALGAAVLLASGGLVVPRDLARIDWGVLILIGGGLALGVAMEEAGVVALVAEAPLEALPRWAIAGAAVLVSVLFSLFMSNTATAALLVPVVLGMALPEEGVLLVLVALGCSFAMATPVSTPPNALAISAKELGVGDLLRVGGAVAAAAVVLVMAGYRLLVPMILPL